MNFEKCPVFLDNPVEVHKDVFSRCEIAITVLLLLFDFCSLALFWHLRIETEMEHLCVLPIDGMFYILYSDVANIDFHIFLF